MIFNATKAIHCMPTQPRRTTIDVNDSAQRIFLALRRETRSLHVTNEHVVQLLDLAEAIATLIASGAGGHMRERHVIARACAAVDAQRAMTGDLRSAIVAVRERLDQLVR